MNPSYMSVDDIKDAMVELGHVQKRIKTIYFDRPKVLFNLRRVLLKFKMMMIILES